MNIAKLKKAKQYAWVTTAVVFIIFVADMLLIQSWSGWLIDLLLAVAGITMVIDAVVSIKEKRFWMVSFEVRGLMAQIAGSVILLVGLIMLYAGITGLIGEIYDVLYKTNMYLGDF